jgi:hypothetical protein
MRCWSFSVIMAALALALFVSQPLLADDQGTKVHEGKVVKAGDGKLTMTGKKGGKEHTHIVPDTAKITCDGKKCQLDELKEGYQVKVTTKDDPEKTVTKIEAKSSTE